MKKSAIMVIILGLLTFGTAFGQLQTDQNVELGFGGVAFAGATSPIRYQLSSPGLEGHATLRINIPFIGDFENATALVYDIPVYFNGGISSGSTQIDLDEQLPFPSKIKYTLYDAASTVRLEGDVLLTKLIPYYAVQPTIGIVSDHPEDYEYLSAVGDVVRLTQSELRGNYLDSFEIIILTGLDSPTLLDRQIDDLKLWVEQGGKLIVAETRFEAPLLNQFTSLKRLRPVAFGYMDVSREIEMYSKIDLASADTVLSVAFSGDKFVDHFQIELGQFIVLGFAPTEDALMGKDVAIAFMKGIIMDHSQGAEKYEKENEIFSLAELKTIPGAIAPSIPIMLIFLGLYVVLIGPVTYILLKKKNKIGNYWIFVVILSIFAVVTIFGYGTLKGYQGRFINVISFTQISRQGTAKVQNYFGIKGTEQDLIIDLPDSGYRVIADDFYTAGESVYARYELDNSPRIIFENISKWSVKLLENHESFDTDYRSQIFYLDAENLKSQFTNQSKWNLKDAILFTGNRVFLLGNIRAGETIFIEKSIEEGAEFNVAGGSYEVNRKLFGDKFYESASTYQKSLMVNSLINGGIHSDTIRLVAWSDDQSKIELRIEGQKAPVAQVNTIFLPVELKYLKGTPIELTGRTLKVDLIQSSGLIFNEFDRSISGPPGEIEIDVIVPRNLENSVLKIDRSLGAEVDLSGYNLMVLNWLEDRYISIINEKATFNSEDLKAFLSSDGRLKLKFEFFEERHIPFPEISVTGVAK